MKRKRTSKQSRTDLQQLRQLGDSEIDFSDIPEIAQEKLSGARVRSELKEIPRGKTRVNLFLDNAIIQFFKMQAGGRGYQTLINETLTTSIRRENLEQQLRRIIREELGK